MNKMSKRVLAMAMAAVSSPETCRWFNAAPMRNLLPKAAFSEEDSSEGVVRFPPMQAVTSPAMTRGSSVCFSFMFSLISVSYVVQLISKQGVS